MVAKTFTTFKLDDQLFGIEVLYVREVNKQLDITPVQHGPDYVRGLINLRGQIITVLDLKKRLQNKDIDVSENSYNVILKTDTDLGPIRQRESRPDLASLHDPVGLLIDEINEIVTIEESDISPSPNNISEIEGRYLSGVVQLEDQLLSILSVGAVLNS